MGTVAHRYTSSYHHATLYLTGHILFSLGLDYTRSIPEHCMTIDSPRNRMRSMRTLIRDPAGQELGGIGESPEVPDLTNAIRLRLRQFNRRTSSRSQQFLCQRRYGRSVWSVGRRALPARVPNGGSLHGSDGDRGKGTGALVIAIGRSPIPLTTARHHTLSTSVSVGFPTGQSPVCATYAVRDI
ncbi:hypothetical protein BDV26DRAFT_223570 [Aspergillus bertholletiae]|uniref:Uncharacterized protein n=1 Tax=Aspergillus bertholletiae TaxID=1226010 RepID=A0A5N7BLN0_9EURO|nr:hypothetical protein BDV26DRAFT_223570 [Aspergillus bertholletiae]